MLENQWSHILLREPGIDYTLVSRGYPGEIILIVINSWIIDLVG
jgi:hypothetical protein